MPLLCLVWGAVPAHCTGNPGGTQKAACLIMPLLSLVCGTVPAHCTGNPGGTHNMGLVCNVFPVSGEGKRGSMYVCCICESVSRTCVGVVLMEQRYGLTWLWGVYGVGRGSVGAWWATSL